MIDNRKCIPIFSQFEQAKMRKWMAKMQGENWDDLRIVLSVARAQSFAGAARRLGVNESTVARRIGQAEERLRARLFERNQGKLAPTEAGAEIARRAERIELEVQASEGAISGADERAAGSVRVTSVPILANRILAPALGYLLAGHSYLRIELIADPRDLSLTKREADIALRLARPQKEVRAIARRIGRLDYAVYGPARRASEALPWITYEDRMNDLPQSRWIAETIARDRAADPRILVSDAESLLRCVAAGLGKSLLPVAIAEHEPGLVRIGESPKALSRELWLMVHPDLRDLIRVRVVMDWITATVERLPLLRD
jgi:DNA-binding transcriptional LysR family regulator